MGISRFECRGQFLLVHDSDLRDLIGACEEMLPAFIAENNTDIHKDWLGAAIETWKEQFHMPPGLMVIWLDEVLLSEHEAACLVKLLEYAAGLKRGHVPMVAEWLQRFVKEAMNARISDGTQIANIQWHPKT